MVIKRVKKYWCLHEKKKKKKKWLPNKTILYLHFSGSSTPSTVVHSLYFEPLYYHIKKNMLKISGAYWNIKTDSLNNSAVRGTHERQTLGFERDKVKVSIRWGIEGRGNITKFSFSLDYQGWVVFSLSQWQ